jgi:hypothetical protein
MKLLAQQALQKGRWCSFVLRPLQVHVLLKILYDQTYEHTYDKKKKSLQLQQMSFFVHQQTKCGTPREICSPQYS